MSHRQSITAAEVVLPCTELEATLEFYIEELGFRIEAIFPADDPAVARLSGHGLTLRLERGLDTPPGLLRLGATQLDEARELVAPNGTRIRLEPADETPPLPANQPSLTLSQLKGEETWVRGRAGMRYRDLIPDRWGGRFIASHIRIPEGGSVPDYVHYHKVRFQMIYCYKGAVWMVYEDQGEPFLMQAGDCVLQPPGIRHQVLETVAGLEVIEIGCPALHPTFADHDMALPTGRLAPDREFGGHQFVWHRASETAWLPWRQSGLEARDFGIAKATNGLAGAQVVRPCQGSASIHGPYKGEFQMLFLLQGTAQFGGERLEAGSALAIPPETNYQITLEGELLEVCLPAL
ncbi:MAG: cupin domain-containing protein [Alphaproteobacteria bacterium]